MEESSLGIPDDRLGAILGAPDGSLVGRADDIADDIGVARGTTFDGIDVVGDDDTKGEPLGSLVGACVGSLLGLFDGVPGADGSVVGTVDVANVGF